MSFAHMGPFGQSQGLWWCETPHPPADPTLPTGPELPKLCRCLGLGQRIAWSFCLEAAGGPWDAGYGPGPTGEQ